MARKYDVLDLYACVIGHVVNRRLVDILTYKDDIEPITIAICKVDRNGYFVQLSRRKKYLPKEKREVGKQCIMRKVPLVKVFDFDHNETFSVKELAHMEAFLVNRLIKETTEEQLNTIETNNYENQQNNEQVM